MKTVVLFFEKGAPTRKVWYYQLDPGRNMGKTNPFTIRKTADTLDVILVYQLMYQTDDNS